MEACGKCEKISHSYDEKPFIAPNHAITYICDFCGQRWWCYNDYYKLWTKVDNKDDLTWESVKRGCPVPVATHPIGRALKSDDIYTILPATKRYAFEEESSSPRAFIKSIVGKETLVVQWFGIYDRAQLRFQFDFPLILNIEEHHISKKHIDELYIIYIGKASRWPWEKHREGLVSKFGEDSIIAYLGCAPVNSFSAVVGVVSLGDPNVGIIVPESHYDETNHFFFTEGLKRQKESV